MTSKPSPVFLREATGLVREVGFLETVGLNISLNLFGIGIFVILSTISLFPGGDPVIGTLLSVLIFVPLAAIYAMMTASMPRSGGDYVFVSRTLHPAFGVVVAWTIVLWTAFFVGSSANYLFTAALGPFFSILGSISQNSSVSSLAPMMS